MPFHIGLDGMDAGQFANHRIQRDDGDVFAFARTFAQRQCAEVPVTLGRQGFLLHLVVPFTQPQPEGMHIGHPVQQHIGAEHLEQQAARFERQHAAFGADLEGEKYRVRSDVRTGFQHIRIARQQAAQLQHLAITPFAIFAQRLANRIVAGKGDEGARWMCRADESHGVRHLS